MKTMKTWPTWLAGLLLCLLALGLSSCTDEPEVEVRGEVSAGRIHDALDSRPNSSWQILRLNRNNGWENVDLLIESGDPLRVARDCVQDRSGAVSCYAFLTREAYRAAGPKGAGNFTLTCWAARWTRNKAGSTSGGVNEFMPSDCPDSAKPDSFEQADITPVEEVSTEAFELELTIEPEVTDGGQVLLKGRTNLPDGTKLATSLSRGDFTGQGGAVVKDGRWQSGPFGARAGLEPGSYEASVTLPYGRTQPDAIQSRLGPRLERLTGPLMKTNPELESLGQSANVNAQVLVR